MANNPMTDTKVLIGEVRFSYAHVFTPDSIDGAEPKYSVSIIIPKSNEALVTKIKAAIATAANTAKSSLWGGKTAGWKNPLRDGDEERPDDPAYEGAYFINASSKRQPGIVKPGVVNGKNAAVAITDENEFYSGCYGYASVNFYGYAKNGNKGVAAGLNNVLKTKDGEFLGGRASADTDFNELIDDLNDDLPEDII